MFPRLLIKINDTCVSIVKRSNLQKRVTKCTLKKVLLNHLLNPSFYIVVKLFWTQFMTLPNKLECLFLADPSCLF